MVVIFQKTKPHIPFPFLLKIGQNFCSTHSKPLLSKKLQIPSKGLQVKPFGPNGQLLHLFLLQNSLANQNVKSTSIG
ncbi:hypothetical protein ES703_102826 [subsurface metagenome]